MRCANQAKDAFQSAVKLIFLWSLVVKPFERSQAQMLMSVTSGWYPFFYQHCSVDYELKKCTRTEFFFVHCVLYNCRWGMS